MRNVIYRAEKSTTRLAWKSCRREFDPDHPSYVAKSRSGGEYRVNPCIVFPTLSFGGYGVCYIGSPNAPKLRDRGFVQLSETWTPERAKQIAQAHHDKAAMS